MTELAHIQDEEGAQVPQKRGFFSWFEPGTSVQEKKLILKLDFFLLTYMCSSWFLKYLDQTNISNAYVSGMSEELGFGEHNELSWFNTYFNIGTIIGSIPMTLLAGYFRPRYFLPLMDTLWSLCVLLLYKCTNAHQMYALRFLIGLFESSANPVGHYLIGSWYKKNEIMRRSGFFIIAGIIGQATSSYIQSGLYSNMNGRLGLAAWKWLFIFDAIIGIPVIIFGLLFIPDYPYNTKAFYLNDWEKEKAVERVKSEGKLKVKIDFDLRQIKVVFTSWQFYAFTVGYSFWTLTACSYAIQWFQLYLKYLGTYTVSQINNIPTAISGVNLITMISSGIISDYLGRRWPVFLIVGCILTFATAVLVADSGRNLRMVGYTLTGVYGCVTPMLAGWCNISCAKNQYLRAVTIPTMLVVGSIVVTPVQQTVFPSNDAPFYKPTHGFAYALAFVLCLTIWCVAVIPLMEHYFGDKNLESNEESEDISSSDIAVIATGESVKN